MNENKPTQTHLERIAALWKKRREILLLPPETALEKIFSAHQPVALVHSFPEEDLYFLVQDVGPEDSIELLSLASNRQWEYILDLELWDKDRVELNAATRWFDLLLRSDPNRFIRWVMVEKNNFLDYYLFKNFEVRVREHDQDPSIFGDDFFTVDDTFYIRVIEYPSDIEPNNRLREHRKEFLSKLLKQLSDYDHMAYQQLLLSASSVIPAESEEENYRLRNVRLAEKGFLPFEEAIGIYQPLRLKDFRKQRVKSLLSRSSELYLPAPLYPTGMMKKDTLFTHSLKKIETDEVLQQIQTEFAGLCNQIIAADQKRIRGREALKEIVRKACGYLSIGLEQLLNENAEITASHAAALITKFPLFQIFRLGFGLALELKWRAERWRKKSWFAKNGLPLSFWSEEWVGVLGGLLIKKPMFYDNYKSGILYREFTSFRDIKQTESVLNEIIGFDHLLSLLEIKWDSFFSYGLLSHKNLILTLWVRDHLKLCRTPETAESVKPITLGALKRFFKDLWVSGEKPRKVKMSMKKAFLDWLSGKTGFNAYEINEKWGQTFENIFKEIENEYGAVSEKGLDSRYIQLFLLDERET